MQRQCDLLNTKKIIANAFCLLMGFIAYMASITVAAESSNDATKNALAKAQYTLRQISAEKTSLEQQIAKLTADNAALQKDLEKYRKDASQQQQQINKQQSQLINLDNNNQQFQNHIENEKTKNGELTAENQRLLARLADQTENFDICYRNNKTLYEINQEILGQYQDKGFWDALSQKEPITALGQVKVENLVQDYQYKMQDLKVKLLSDEKAE